MKDGFGDSYQYGEWGSVAEDSIKGHFEDASEIFHLKTRGWSICQSFLIPRCCSVVHKGIEVLGYLCSSWVALHSFGESCEAEKQSHPDLLGCGQRQRLPQLCWIVGTKEETWQKLHRRLLPRAYLHRTTYIISPFITNLSTEPTGLWNGQGDHIQRVFMSEEAYWIMKLNVS